MKVVLISLGGLLLKMHLASSDGQVHEMVSHLGTTHLALEPVIISTFRLFSENHPVFRLLKPHMRQTIAINELGRRTLLNDGGFFDEITSLGMVGTMRLIEVSWDTFNYSERSFPMMNEVRGFPEVPRRHIATEFDTLPGYLYRDYGYMVWNSIYRYTTKVIEKYYPTDDLIEKDILLQRWAHEIAHEDFGNLRGFPSSIKTKQQLIDTCAIFINTASAQHSAVNFGQFDYYGFIPFRPLALSLPMPPSKEDMAWDYVLRALPGLYKTLKQMTITYILSNPPKFVMQEDPRTKTFLGNTIGEAFDLTESYWAPSFEKEWRELVDELKKHTEEMITYNLINGYEYNYLFADDIALSIAI